MKEKLTIIKIGGKIIEDDTALNALLARFAAIQNKKILIHGGGRTATDLAAKLGVETIMTNGRRVTDLQTLKIVTMVYAGLINKNITARLQALNVNALGLTGADMNIIRARRRISDDIDYGYVGDPDKTDGPRLAALLLSGITPVIAPITHDGNGNLLNTNADTVAAETAKSLSADFDVDLIFCFEKKGVLLNPNDDNSLIPHINSADYQKLLAQHVIKEGMLPKLLNAFSALHAGVRRVIITRPDQINTLSGTIIEL